MMTLRSASGWKILTGFSTGSISRIGVKARGVVWVVSIILTEETCSSADAMVGDGVAMVRYRKTAYRLGIDVNYGWEGVRGSAAAS